MPTYQGPMVCVDDVHYAGNFNWYIVFEQGANAKAIESAHTGVMEHYRFTLDRTHLIFCHLYKITEAIKSREKRAIAVCVKYAGKPVGLPTAQAVQNVSRGNRAPFFNENRASILFINVYVHCRREIAILRVDWRVPSARSRPSQSWKMYESLSDRRICKVANIYIFTHSANRAHSFRMINMCVMCLEKNAKKMCDV